RIHDVRVVWIDDDPADDSGLLQPDVAPGSAAVGRFVHSVAGQERIPESRIAGTDVNDLRVRGRNCNRADVVVLEILVGDVLPAAAVIPALPHSAAAC